MGLFDFFRRRRDKESAIPEPGSSDFQQQVADSELPGSSGTTEAPGGWASVGDASSTQDLAHRLAAQFGGNVELEQGASRSIDLRGTGAREEIVELLKKRGIDPDSESGQQIDAGSIPGLQEEILEVLKRRGLNLPGS